MAAGAKACLKRFIEGLLNNLRNIIQNNTKSTSANHSVSNANARRDCTGSVINASAAMELELLDRKLRRLVCKLKKHDIFVEVFDHKDIEYGDMLGKGGEAEVRKCTVIYNNVAVEAAVKTVLDNSDDAISITLDEIELLCLARDPIINTTLQVYGVAAVPDDDDPEMGHLVIVTEAGLMNALQLYQQEAIPLWITLDLWSRLAAALYTMHNRRIIHHDLKPENILITALNRDRFGCIEKIDFRVIDLGMGKRVYTEYVQTDDILGTNGYHAPEVLQEDSYDFKADIFMLGITFCVLLQSSEFLAGKSNLSSLLKQIHAAKKRNQTGRSLYDRVIAPTYEDSQNIPVTIINMICVMLEEQDQRTISLLDVIKICAKEASKLKPKQSNNNSEVLQPPCANCQQDSGISSSEGQSKVSRPRRRAAAKRSNHSSASSAIMVSDSIASSTRTYNTRQSSTLTTPSNSSTTSQKSRHRCQRELDALFEPWMGETLMGETRRGTKRFRSEAPGIELRKRNRNN